MELSYFPCEVIKLRSRSLGGYNGHMAEYLRTVLYQVHKHCKLSEYTVLDHCIRLTLGFYSGAQMLYIGYMAACDHISS